jgi:hypothetical protein
MLSNHRATNAVATCCIGLLLGLIISLSTAYISDPARFTSEDATSNATSLLPPVDNPVVATPTIARVRQQAQTTGATQSATDAPVLNAMSSHNSASAALAPANGEATPQRVAALVAALHTGALTATATYADGTRTVVNTRFDFGQARQNPRVWIKTAYRPQDGATAYVTERLLFGTQAWERGANGRWELLATQGHILHEVEALLPDANAITTTTDTDLADELRWYDARRDADVTLLLDPGSGLPREMRQATRSTGIQLVIGYEHWNQPISLPQPDDK